MTDEPPGGTPAETPRAAPEPPPQDPFLPPKIVYGLYALGYFVGITGACRGHLCLSGTWQEPGGRQPSDLSDRNLLVQPADFFAGILTAFIVVGLFILLFLLVWG